MKIKISWIKSIIIFILIIACFGNSNVFAKLEWEEIERKNFTGQYTGIWSKVSEYLGEKGWDGTDDLANTSEIASWSYQSNTYKAEIKNESDGSVSVILYGGKITNENLEGDLEEGSGEEVGYATKSDLFAEILLRLANKGYTGQYNGEANIEWVSSKDEKKYRAEIDWDEENGRWILYECDINLVKSGGVLGNSTADGSHTLDGVINDAQGFISAGKEQGSKIDANNLQAGSNTLYNILLAVGIFLAVAVGMYLGIKFMLSSAEDKAKVKESLIPYIAGCVVIFGAFIIWKLALILLAGLE